MSAGVDVDLRGPLFNGEALRQFDELDDDMKLTVAEAGVVEVKSALESQMKDPTGFYVSQLETDRKHGDRLVTDGGVVYGPWLAGVDSRNRTSRFKGYTHWRRAAQRLEAKVEIIVQPVVSRRVRRMNE